MSHSLSNFLVHAIPGFTAFLESRPDYESLGESLDVFRSQLRSENKLDDSLDKQIRSAYIHYSTGLQTPDCVLLSVKDFRPEIVSYIEEFDLLASQSIYNKRLDEQIVKDVLYKYRNERHPYICAEITRVFLADKDYDTGLRFCVGPFRYLLDNTVELWHDPYGVYGMAMILNSLVNIISIDIRVEIDRKYPDILKKLVELTYLFLSRVICWPEDRMASPDGLSNLPITYYHKRSCCLLRKSLLFGFPEVFEGKVPSQSTSGTLQVSDYITAHLFSFHNLGDRGKKSEMKKYAKELYSELEGDGIRPFYTAASDGRIDSVELAYRYYLKYIDHPIDLNENHIQDIVRIVNANLQSKVDKPEMKDDYRAIGDYLHKNNISFFYHFTEEKNLTNIRRYGGLLSQYQCVMQAIPVRTEASTFMVGLREKDNKFGLEDYARLSFCSVHPLIDIRKEKGARLVRLKVSTDIAYLKDTLFSDKDAATEHHHGPGLDDLKRVDFNATSRIVHYDVDPQELCLRNQAEILVRTIIPKEYIINLDNPEII